MASSSGISSGACEPPSCDAEESENTPCGSGCTSELPASGFRSRCLASDSPGSNPLPSHVSGVCTMVEGFDVDAGREDAEVCGEGFAAGSPPYFDSDSPGRTNGVDSACCDERRPYCSQRCAGSRAGAVCGGAACKSP